MTCEHCMAACTARGSDMSEFTFTAAVALAKSQDDLIVIGGGEPTLHPKFWLFMGIMFSKYSRWWPETPSFIVTNGSRTEDALALAAMASRGVIGAAVSRDSWHDPIDPEVYEAFRRGKGENDYREIRTVRTIIKAGRARKWGDVDACACDELFVDPSGRLWQCGCRTKSFGTVFAPSIPEDYEGGSCAKQNSEKLEFAEK